MTTPVPQVWPALSANDARAMINFLVEAFGFIEVVAYGEGDEIAHAELAWPLGGGIMMGSNRKEPGRVWQREPGTFGAYVVTDDPDGLHDRALKAGATIVMGLTDTDYGSRDFIARDPEGNLWSFGTYPGAPRPTA
jgi:uncharacterized glyoxalase superfamily protein PhnB